MDFRELLNSMIDDRIGLFGLDNTIAYLLDYNISEYSLRNDFGFSQEDIDRVKYGT